MSEKPEAITKFEEEALAAFDTGSFSLEHPIDRLIYHIESSGGRVIDSHSDIDGKAMVTWESKGVSYSAWSTWPGDVYKVDWKKV